MMSLPVGKNGSGVLRNGRLIVGQPMGGERVLHSSGREVN